MIKSLFHCMSTMKNYIENCVTVEILAEILLSTCYIENCITMDNTGWSPTDLSHREDVPFKLGTCTDCCIVDTLRSD